MNAQDEKIIMEIIVNGGEAKSKSLEAVECAKKGDFVRAEQLLKLADDKLHAAHEVQTDMIRNEINGDNYHVTLMMVHAQDHVMNASTVRALAEEIIEVYKKLKGE